MALIAFAANSVLCRLALGAQEIDAMSFTVIRLLSGSVMLFVLVALFESNRLRQLWSYKPHDSAEEERQTFWQKYGLIWLGPLFLFSYALTFSYAYLSLDTGTGALILFAVVQITMIMFAIFRGSALRKGEIIGLLVGFTGFVYLLYPSLTGPSLYGLLLMVLSGVAWAGYTLVGQGSASSTKNTQSPLFITTKNFILTLPLCLVWFAFTFSDMHFSMNGVILGVLSGAVTSGLGYAIWYKALQSLSTTIAAVSQLLVPVFASIGGVLLVNEAFTWHLFISSVVVLGGILLVILSRKA
ncbi:DMT family transporter [Marinomonas agarivorans]|nr:DMT family transporter [Marinomonas agarivorans]